MVKIEAKDRRRPGRRDVDPALIPLLRGTYVDPDTSETAEDPPEAEDGEFGRGFLFGLVLLIPAWIIIGVAVFVIMGMAAPKSLLL